MSCNQEAPGCQKKGSTTPSPTSFESFIFSVSFLGRGVLVPTLQMRESALPQAAPAVCLTRGAVSGRMDLLNLSSRFLYPHLLFCFPLTAFANSSRYSSPLSPSLTFSHPVPLPCAPSLSALAPSAPFSCPTAVPCMPEMCLGTSPCTPSCYTSIPLRAGHGMGTPRPRASPGGGELGAGFGGETSLPSPPGSMGLSGKGAAFLISQVSCACCGQIADLGGF